MQTDSISSRYRSTTSSYKSNNSLNPNTSKFLIPFLTFITFEFDVVRNLSPLRLHYYHFPSPSTTFPHTHALSQPKYHPTSLSSLHFFTTLLLNHNPSSYSSSQIYYGRTNISSNNTDFNSSVSDPFDIIQHAKGKDYQAHHQGYQRRQEEEGYV